MAKFKEMSENEVKKYIRKKLDKMVSLADDKELRFGDVEYYVDKITAALDHLWGKEKTPEERVEIALNRFSDMLEQTDLLKKSFGSVT